MYTCIGSFCILYFDDNYVVNVRTMVPIKSKVRTMVTGDYLVTCFNHSTFSKNIFSIFGLINPDKTVFWCINYILKNNICIDTIDQLDETWFQAILTTFGLKDVALTEYSYITLILLLPTWDIILSFTYWWVVRGSSPWTICHVYSIYMSETNYWIIFRLIGLWP